ncbi:MAG: DUF4878 domain-containing protein [Planctomycetes bacterium]|nr:DUF4878 domain-containing protein [Planctomycetota bacterium]
MVRNALSVLALVMVLAVAACGGSNDSNGSSSSSGGSAAPAGPDYSTPAATMKAIAEAFATLDVDKMKACYGKAAGEDRLKKIESEMKQIKEDGMKFELTFKDEDIQVEGDKAKVKARLKITTKDGKTEDESETFELVKEDGLWKAVR